MFTWEDHPQPSSPSRRDTPPTEQRSHSRQPLQIRLEIHSKYKTNANTPVTRWAALPPSSTIANTRIIETSKRPAGTPRQWWRNLCVTKNGHFHSVWSPHQWWNLCVTKNDHFLNFSVTEDRWRLRDDRWRMTDDKAGQVQSELSAGDMKRNVENTPKCTRPYCILAWQSSLLWSNKNA